MRALYASSHLPDSRRGRAGLFHEAPLASSLSRERECPRMPGAETRARTRGRMYRVRVRVAAISYGIRIAREQVAR